MDRIDVTVGKRKLVIGKWVLATALFVMGLVAITSAVSQVDSVPPNLGAYLEEGVSVRTAGGGSFQGTLMGVEPDRIELLLADGQILQIARSELSAFAILDRGDGARAFYEDSASNRLVVMPTAFPMDRGEFQIADQEIAAVTGSYGITEWLSVWGGISIPGALFSLRASTHLADATGVSIGGFVGASWFDWTLGPLILPYTLVSFGEDNNNLTLGSGFMMTFSSGFEIPGAVLAVAGKRTLTATTAVVTENWIVWARRTLYDEVSGSDTAMWSAVPYLIVPTAVFRIASNRLTWDIGAFVPLIIDGSATGYSLSTPVIPFPILSVSYRIR